MAKSTKAELLKYKDLLLQSSQEREEQEVEFRVEEMEQSLQADILATKRALAARKSDLARAKSSYPLNADKIIEFQIDIEGMEDGLKRLNALREELF